MKNLKQILQYNKVFVFLGIILLIYILLFTKVIKYSSKYNGSELEITGKVTSIKLDGNKLALTLKAKEKVVVSYYIETEKEKKEILNLIHLGDKLLLKGSFNEPLNNTIPNTFNYKKYLYNKRIYYTFTATNYKKIGNNNFIYKIKDKLLKNIYNRDNNDYYLAFILGDKSLLTSDIFNTYQKNGISHLLAISGMHINMLVLILSMLFKNKKKNFVATTTFLIFYLFLTGITASILRAILFYILKNINDYGAFKYSNMHILIISAYIILFIDPFMIYDIGFIYSFVVCFGIIYYKNYLTGNYISKLLKLSIITFLFSLPITCLLNYEINLSSIFINLIFIPWISLLLYPFTLISFILPFLNPILTLLINVTNNLNFLFSKLSILINVPRLPIILIILYYLILLSKKFKKIVYLIVVILISKILPLMDNNYNVFFLDIGQGDSCLLVSPHNKETILIDTGGKLEYQTEKWQEKSKTYHLSDNTIKFLKSKGITSISYLIITHGDADHAKESLNIINNLNIKNVVLNNGSNNNIEKEILNSHVKVTQKYKLKYFNITNLNNETYDNENDNSIVNYITFLNYKFLFMGDASSKVETNLLNKYNLKNIDVLKIGHHGSKYSSNKFFIDNINPKYSIISVGRNNRYNHPHKEVLENLKNRKILRTDLLGTINFRINKNNLKINYTMP